MPEDGLLDGQVFCTTGLHKQENSCHRPDLRYRGAHCHVQATSLYVCGCCCQLHCGKALPNVTAVRCCTIYVEHEHGGTVFITKYDPTSPCFSAVVGSFHVLNGGLTP